MQSVQSRQGTTDQDELQTFLDLSEQGEMQFFPAKYTADGGQMLTILLRKGELPGWTSTPLLCTQQPIPNYWRWFKTGELHYLPLKERMLLFVWDNTTRSLTLS